jgi:hypothetical protein
MRVRTNVIILYALIAPGVCRDARAVLCSGIQQPICTFPDDDAGFMLAAGTLRTIDFETLPNGSPSVNGTLITPSFNYTNQGVTFTPAEGLMYIIGTGPPPDAHGLAADAPQPSVNSIISDFVVPTPAVGIYFGGGTLEAFDEFGTLLGSVSFGRPGISFEGIVSDVPIARAVISQGIESEIINSFLFNPTPEPASVVLAATGAIVLLKRGRR